VHSRSVPWGVTFPEDAARWEVNHVLYKWLRVQRQRRQSWSAAWTTARPRGEDTPSEPESLEEDEEDEEKEGEVIPPPHSPL
jgi:hypothetical protein